MEPLDYKFVNMKTGNYWMLFEYEEEITEEELSKDSHGVYPIYAPIEDEV